MKLTFDENAIDIQIKAFKLTNNRCPYVICSKSTYEMMPISKKCGYDMSAVLYFPQEPDHKNPVEPDYRYNNCKVFFDNDLPIGEVIFA